MLPTYHNKEGEVPSPKGDEAKPEFKNNLLSAIEANLKVAELDEIAMGDYEEAAKIKKEEEGVEKEKDSE